MISLSIDGTEIAKGIMNKDTKEIKDDNNKYVGKQVRNLRDGKLGVILRITDSGSIQVLEKVAPVVINTHDNWSTLELVEDREASENEMTSFFKKRFNKIY